jgi:hypothetical protein
MIHRWPKLRSTALSDTQLPKLHTRVRFPSPAPINSAYKTRNSGRSGFRIRVGFEKSRTTTVQIIRSKSTGYASACSASLRRWTAAMIAAGTTIVAMMPTMPITMREAWAGVARRPRLGRSPRSSWRKC